MILTVTLNSALDRVIYIDEFQPGSVMRTERVVTSVGGKGFDASVVLRTLEADTTAVGFVAGPTGQELVRLLDGYGLDHDLVWVGGDTRLAHVVVETNHHRHSHIVTGAMSFTDEHVQALKDSIQARLPQADWMVAAGASPVQLPAATYRMVVELARTAGVPSLVDSSGAPMRELLPCPPTIFKLSRDEFNQTFGLDTASLTELEAAADDLLMRHKLPGLVITCGKDGILAFTPEGKLHAEAPVQQVVNAAGAGDGVSAALAWRLSQGDSWGEALRWGAATGAAVVLTEGTADCRMEDIQRILPDVKLSRL